MKQKAKHEKSKKTSKGSALLLATVLLFVVLSMVVSLTYVTVMEQKMSGKTKSSVGSFFNADSGVEWALNKIANKGGTISAVFPGINAATGEMACPDFGSGSSCNVYLLDSQGKVINSSNPNSITTTSDISEVKAVRSIGTHSASGEATTRAIEAAVAASGDYQLQCNPFGGSYVCCRLNTSNGSTDCKYANGGLTAWTDFVDPW